MYSRLATCVAVMACVFCSFNARSLSADETFQITPDVVYGHKAGMALTYDVIQHKEHDNDAAVLFMMSGGWNSRWVDPRGFVNPLAPAGYRHFRKLVEAGYTLYIVRHGSAPRFKVPEAVDDVRKALRHIRNTSEEFGIDRDKIGVCGGSAGGHLSLMLGTTGEDATSDKDAGTRLAAVVAYFPPVELNEYVGQNDDYPALEFDPKLADSVSPLLHVTSDDAPTLLVHGTEDTLVPLDNSTRIEKAFREKKVATKLVVIDGAAHGFGGDAGKRASDELIAWFDRHLLKKQKNYPPQMEGCTTEIYKTVGDTNLNIYIFNPKDHSPNESRPAAVFFFGGGWRAGTPQQFEQHCRYLASRGMVAMTADYRVVSRNGTTADACVADGKSAIRWVRQNAKRLGINPQRVLAGGGSAGGHVAACTATIAGFEEAGEDLAISSRPDGLALFNPALVLATVPGQHVVPAEKLASLKARMGVPPERLSPFHQLQSALPPTIVFHGKADTTVPYKTAELFVQLEKPMGTTYCLMAMKGRGTGSLILGVRTMECTTRRWSGWMGFWSTRLSCKASDGWGRRRERFRH